MEKCMHPLTMGGSVLQGAAGHKSTGGNKYRRRKPPSRKWMFRMSLLLAIFILSTAGFHSSSLDQSEFNAGNYHSRSLLSSSGNVSSGCGAHSADLPFWEQCEFECNHIPALWCILYAILILILFVGMAIVCDEFFVPSLEAISEKLELSEDVAGATFMAAGSSAPELFTSVLGVIFNSDVGVGTIVGSAVFNILIIIALTAALAGQVLELDWRPLCRDSTFYAISIICFIIFSWDGYLQWWESLGLLVLYVIYIILMKFNSDLMDSVCLKRKVSPMMDEESNAEGSACDAADPISKDDSLNYGKPPRTLPPLAQVGRKDSVQSKQSLGAPTSKHIFHHVKHGEFSHHFTSSQIDLRKFTDTERPGSAKSTRSVRSRKSVADLANLKSRPSSSDSKQAMVVTQNDESKNPPTNGDIYAITSSPAGDSRVQSPIQPKHDMELKEIDSLGGDSTYGSQANLLGPPNKNMDADSGIHSTQGLTPTIPSDPSFPSYNDVDDEQVKRQSIMVHLQHGEHLHGLHHHHGHHTGTTGSAATTSAIVAETEDVIEEEEDEEELTLRPIPCFCAVNMYYPSKDILDSTCGLLRLILKWVLFCISFPFMCMFTWTIPNCATPRFKKWYNVTFGMSIVWIAVLSFSMVTLVTKTGCILQVDHYTMGLVVVAVGTSVPDALSSVLVARDGFGDMAVSNAIGSNVFDINLGLGLPYLIRACFSNFQAVELLTEYERNLREMGNLPLVPHAKFGFLLLLILFMTLLTFAIARFRLNWIIGVAFVTMYALFLVYAFIQELVCDYNC